MQLSSAFKISPSSCLVSFIKVGFLKSDLFASSYFISIGGARLSSVRAQVFNTSS